MWSSFLHLSSYADTIWPRSLNLFHIVSDYMIWVMTSWSTVVLSECVAINQNKNFLKLYEMLIISLPNHETLSK